MASGSPGIVHISLGSKGVGMCEALLRMGAKRATMRVEDAHQMGVLRAMMLCKAHYKASSVSNDVVQGTLPTNCKGRIL